MISINYDAHECEASISSSEIDGGWIHIRRLFSDCVDETKYISDSELRMPWWGFLGTRKRLLKVIRLYRIQFSISKSAQSELKKAIFREERFANPEVRGQLTAKEILAKLGEGGFSRELKKPQLRNLQHMMGFHAAATFSVPGSGKTTEALAYYTINKKADSRLIVFSPINAFAAWEEQLEECLKDIGTKFVRLRGGINNIAETLTDLSPALMLMSYHQFAREGVRTILANYILEKTSFIFLDESHRIKKGIEGKIGSHLLGISHIPDWKLVLSGTPMPNSVSDLIPQFSFLYPEIEVDENNVIDLIRTVYVRTTKKELEIPPVKRSIISLKMSAGQEKLYDLARKESFRRFEEAVERDARTTLRRIGRSALRLLQIASNPTLLTNVEGIRGVDDILDEVLEDDDSPKIVWTCDRARMLAASGRKVIIWTSFVANVETISYRLKDLGADYIHGGVEPGDEDEEDTREAKIKRFHDDPNAFVLVANPAAASEGISLHTVCNNAIYVDRTFNAAHYMQSEDRIHRLGLPADAKIEVEILMSEKTIDERVNNRLIMKVNKMAEVLEDTSLVIDPIEYSLEGDGVDEDDMQEIIEHLSGD